MPRSTSFFRTCAALSALAAVLVLVAQLGLDGSPGPTTRAEAIEGLTDPVYRARAWTILVQVFFMFLGLWGGAVAAGRRSPGLIWTGFLVFALWQVLELIPRGLGLWTLSYDWAPAWLAAGDAGARSALEAQIVTLDGILAGMGGIRRQLWALGHLLFGLAFVRWSGMARVLGVLFLLNAGRLVVRTLGEAAGIEPLAQIVSGRVPFILGMVPLFGLLAVWLWREAPGAQGPQPRMSQTPTPRSPARIAPGMSAMK